MSSNKVSFEDSLKKHVVDSGKCLGCRTCVVVCPFVCLDYAGGRPLLIKECEVCGICARACPQYDWVLCETEKFVFGRERKSEEEFGIYRKLVIARATDNQILQVCQDGGVVTALLLFALKEGIIDGAIVTAEDPQKPLYPLPKLATTAQEILQSAGTKYFYSPSILALKEAIKQKKREIAFVGTPCQIRAIRKMEMAGLKKYTAPLKFLIGLACSECFNYEGLMENHIHGKLGINLDGIKKMNIKGSMLVKLESETVSIPLAEIKQYARENCSSCNDFSSELADISVGGLGLENWSFVIIRTEKGEELFSKAERAGVIKTRDVNEELNTLKLLRKLSRKKAQRSIS